MIDLPVGTRLVLASSSPRRAELLARVGLDFDVRPAAIDEAHRVGESPVAYVERLAVEKAAAVDRRSNEIVLAADTTVEVDLRILGKPVDRDDARTMLWSLSGRTHRVHTGIAVVSDVVSERVVVTTIVTFAELEPSTIEWYLDGGESMDKAGAYAMQGAGAALVAAIDGSATNVIGLPLMETLAMIDRNARRTG
jgi:septum formation protein